MDVLNSMDKGLISLIMIIAAFSLTPVIEIFLYFITSSQKIKFSQINCSYRLNRLSFTFTSFN